MTLRHWLHIKLYYYAFSPKLFCSESCGPPFRVRRLYWALLDCRGSPRQGWTLMQCNSLWMSIAEPKLSSQEIHPSFSFYGLTKDSAKRFAEGNKVCQATYYHKEADRWPHRTGKFIGPNLSPDSFKQEDLLMAEVKPEVGLRRYQVVTEDGKNSGETKIIWETKSFSTHANQQRCTPLSIMLRYWQTNLGIRTAANTPPIQATLTSDYPNSNVQEPLPMIP